MIQNGKKYEEINTFAHRPCFTQIISYAVVLLVNISFWVCVQPHFHEQVVRFIMITSFLITFIILVIVAAITSYLDPSDPLIREYLQNNQDMIKGQFHNCVFCQHCQSYVLNTSRHCKKCDRQKLKQNSCVHKFDHHCIWINNCVGAINYRFFIAMIYAAVSHLFLYVLSLALLWSQQSWKDYVGKMVVGWFAGLVSTVFGILIVALISLHMYLIWHNMTTFEYIMLKKAEDQRARATSAMKIEDNTSKAEEKPSDVMLVSSKQQHKTESIFQPPSAFLQMSRSKQTQKMEESSVVSAFKHSRHRVNSKLHQFEMIEIIPPKVDEIDPEEQIQKVYQKSRSLKILVGNSISIKSRRNGSELASEKSSSKKNMSQKSSNIDKENDKDILVVQYFRQNEQRDQQIVETNGQG